MKNLKKVFNYLTKPRIDYQPLIEVRISKSAILHNLHAFQKKSPNVQFAPVLKSNAYGHGLVPVAEILDKEKLPFFVVDSFYEALTLRQNRINTPLLILGYSRVEQMCDKTLKHVNYTILSLETLSKLVHALKFPKKFHLKIDTGMHRQGILVSEIPAAIKLIHKNKNVILDGICSHLADSDGDGKEFTLRQIKTWNNLVHTFKKEFPKLSYMHLANSAGSYYSSQVEANVSRLGIGLFGIHTSPLLNLKLKPALEMRSIITGIKRLKPGDKVGYNCTFTAKKNMTIATVPVGYNEGINRKLSNKGGYYVGKTYCPILGRVSMNISTIDVSKVKKATVETPVTLISAQKNALNSVVNMAKLCDLIPYDILVHVTPHVRRIVTD